MMLNGHVNHSRRLCERRSERAGIDGLCRLLASIWRRLGSCAQPGGHRPDSNRGVDRHRADVHSGAWGFTAHRVGAAGEFFHRQLRRLSRHGDNGSGSARDQRHRLAAFVAVAIVGAGAASGGTAMSLKRGCCCDTAIPDTCCFDNSFCKCAHHTPGVSTTLVLDLNIDTSAVQCCDGVPTSIDSFTINVSVPIPVSGNSCNSGYAITQLVVDSRPVVIPETPCLPQRNATYETTINAVNFRPSINLFNFLFQTSTSVFPIGGGVSGGISFQKNASGWCGASMSFSDASGFACPSQGFSLRVTNTWNVTAAVNPQCLFCAGQSGITLPTPAQVADVRMGKKPSGCGSCGDELTGGVTL